MSNVAALPERIRAAPQAAAGLGVALAAAATLAGAWFFQYGLGLDPCPLCLDQRVPYYIAVPLGLAAAWLARSPGRLPLARAGLAALGLALVVGAALGIYHSGIEWGWWQGPASCAGAAPGTPVSNILFALKDARPVVPCNEAAWRFLGLSLAGYNALIAGALGAISLWAARATARQS